MGSDTSLTRSRRDTDEPGAQPGRYTSLPDLGGGGTIADRLYGVLSTAIIEGTLPPGTQLMVDALSERYGISMIPVRECLRSLQATGWVTSQAHRRTYVRSRSQEELSDLYEMRELTEPAASRLAAQRRDAEDLRALAAVVEEGFVLQREGRARDFSLVNSSFHELVSRASRNQVMYEYQRQINERVRFYSSVLPMDRIHASVQEHEQLLEAIRERDSERAAAISLNHIRQSRHSLAREDSLGP